MSSHRWAYSLYILPACAVTSGLNIVHSKYILEVELTTAQFVVPTLAGVIFGAMCARLRSQTGFVIYRGEPAIYAGYILFSCFVTTFLNVVHTEWILDRRLEARLFVAPTIAGVFFGFLIARIKTLNFRLAQLAGTDSLTLTYNRMQFDLFLSMELERAQRYGGHFSLIMLDVDHFKQINDRHGHPAGDMVLARLCELVKAENRRSDILARYGGEEFAILAGGTPLAGAAEHARRLCAAINRHDFSPVPGVTCSFGVAEFDKARHDSTRLIKAADDALYRAKKAGRDRVECDGNSDAGRGDAPRAEVG